MFWDKLDNVYFLAAKCTISLYWYKFVSLLCNLQQTTHISEVCRDCSVAVYYRDVACIHWFSFLLSAIYFYLSVTRKTFKCFHIFLRHFSSILDEHGDNIKDAQVLSIWSVSIFLVIYEQSLSHGLCLDCTQLIGWIGTLLITLDLADPNLGFSKQNPE